MLSLKFRGNSWLLRQFQVTNKAFCGLKYSYVGKDNIRGKAMQIWIRKTGFLLNNLRSCDLRTGAPSKFAD